MEVYRLRGLNAAERESGVSKKTVQKYARERGIEPPTSQAVRDQTTLASLRAAQVRSRRVNEKIDKGIDRTVNLLELAQAQETRILARIKPDELDADGLRDALTAITRSRTTAVKDLEMLLRRAGMLVGSADGSDVIDVVRACVRGALDDIGLPVEQREAFSKAFAGRLRAAQGNEEETAATAELEAGDEIDGDADELDEDGEEAA